VQNHLDGSSTAKKKWREMGGECAQGSEGQSLVQQSPLTLLALTRHEVEPHEVAWYARCRADYLRSFPFSLLEIVRLALLLMVGGSRAAPAFMFCALAGCAIVIGLQAWAREREGHGELDQVEVLRRRAITIRFRSCWWSMMLCWAALTVPAGNEGALVALAIVLLVIDGISALTVPHVALWSSFSAAAALGLGLVLREGFASNGPILVCLLIAASFQHWSIYNLYYLFATRRIRTKRLSQSNETVQLLLNQYDDDGSDWLYSIDRNGLIRKPSARFSSACARSCEALDGVSFSELIGHGENCDELIQKFESRQPFRNHVIAVKVEGAERWWSVSGRPVSDRVGQPDGWRGFIADVTVAKKAEARVAYLAHYDLLTQLPNRTLFNATLGRTFARRKRDDLVALFYIDLDHFKAINDGYGHAAGDQVLIEVARRLEANLRPQDMVARLGGDEFVILLSHLETTNDALALAERILEEISQPVEIEGQIMPMGASIGMAFAPHNALDGDELLRAADLAMYDAKSRGRRGISMFDPQMQEVVKDRRALEIDLRAAIARGQLELHYQPLIDLRDGTTSGYEALLRWNHPERGQVPPDDFIPVAEESGVIVEIGDWVIRTALHEAARWPEELTVAVNLSPVQIHDPNLFTIILHALAASGVAATRLELEITESLLMQDSEATLAVLHKLREIGIRIALDDFGTGYSSLNYLRSFPFDKIKIDRCFVQELADREDCQAIVRSVIALANDLNITTLAEGVEAAEQLARLRTTGCDQVQGFYYSRALPAADLNFGDFRGQSPKAEAPVPSGTAQPTARARKRAANG